jgi:hypothetical protein
MIDTHRLGGNDYAHQDSRGTASDGEPSLCLTCRFATVAWVLRSDPKKNEVGFVKRTELTRRERFELDDDEVS